ncbi:putative dehydrogenase [Herbaspirillum sp. CF444]|uniref:Gfo/Idh/MocA family protein n=1 Tax=Herbaspirillum sp. CF444 TaxID=1144319 RepID=UPI0002722E17|nr:Gfo/Idh/MocA family oxidoreductase [Herbaspirillum sp. CF444]EJL81418.1 putative dehydrogenase [Herbaspirillum sp. CF444]
MSKALVVGYGSIGARHVRILEESGHEVAVVSRRRINVRTCYAGLDEALQQYEPAYVVIANRTSEHRDTLQSLNRAGFTGDILVEKPLFEAPGDLEPGGGSGRVFVAYNLRFHAVLQRLKTLLQGERMLSAQIYVGQYLPQWRPQADYRTSYSASAGQGGGVLRDLSHELDYIAWLFNGWSRVAALGGHFSSLEIDSDDVFSVLLETPGCPVVSLQMNYLDRVGRRVVIINTDSGTIEADLVRGTVTMNDQIESIVSGRDDTYREMHAALLGGRHETLCTFRQGAEVLDLIAAIEQAAGTRQWVSR